MLTRPLLWTIGGALLGLGIGLMAGHTPIGLVISTALGAIAGALIRRQLPSRPRG